MERIQRQRSNPSSSTQSRSNKFRSNPTTKDDKIPNTNNPDDSTDSAKSRRGHVDDCSNLPALLGTCPFMCPVAERSQRERLRDLAVFERLHGNPRKTSADLAVKKPMNSSSIGASSPHKNKVEVEVVGSNLPGTCVTYQ
uniref:SAC3/GANP/THP3 conserved domain-containing protein n=1 Tax=Fagus sylvatica TaxID=28930 RepID=A0A2N9FNP5_FAGSY